MVVKLFLVSLLYILSTQVSSGNGFDIFLNEKEDIHQTLWEFSRDRPYKYFEKTSEIPESFLPVQVKSIPEGKGLWVLRYKDFSGPPKFFYSEAHDASVSVIKFATKSQLFQSIKVKAIIHGDTKLDLVHNTKKGRVEKVDMGAFRTLCMNTTETEDNGTPIKWIDYHFQMEPTAHVSLEAKVLHPYSFLIIDEIHIKFATTEDPKVETDDGFEDIKIQGSESTRLKCKALD